MKIAILGFGTVGTGVYDIIQNSSSDMLKDVEISKILVRNKDKIKMPIMTDSFDEIVNDENIDIIVEVMGGETPAYEYIMRALKAKKHVVSANKAVIAKHLKEFTETASQNGVTIQYEASVGGGIPWIKSILKAKRIDKIQEVSGILNGTSNFILYNMFKNGYEFNDILKIAQDKGYAEADPSADIDGFDIQRKLAITASLCFDAEVLESDIPIKGIRNVTKEDIDYFNELGYVLKLLAKGVAHENSFCASIGPVLFAKDSIEANVNDNFNIGSLIGESIGELKFYGQGAGKLATGNAIVQDILDIKSKNYEEYDIKFNRNLSKDYSLIKGKYYIRSKSDQLENVFEGKFESINKKGDTYYMITSLMSVGDFHDLITIIAEKDNDVFFARFN